MSGYKDQGAYHLEDSLGQESTGVSSSRGIETGIRILHIHSLREVLVRLKGVGLWNRHSQPAFGCQSNGC
jgi:hypothetical protein